MSRKMYEVWSNCCWLTFRMKKKSAHNELSKCLYTQHKPNSNSSEISCLRRTTCWRECNIGFLMHQNRIDRENLSAFEGIYTWSKWCDFYQTFIITTVNNIKIWPNSCRFYSYKENIDFIRCLHSFTKRQAVTIQYMSKRNANKRNVK